MTTWEIKKPLIEGQEYVVPCHVESEVVYLNDDKQKVIYTIYPLLPPHKHTKSVNVHYHVDNRFVDINKKHSKYKFVFDSRVDNPNIEYLKLKCVKSYITGADSVTHEFCNDTMIDNKCPHLGYDLSQIIPVNDVITCPMHGTKICNKTKKILKQ